MVILFVQRSGRASPKALHLKEPDSEESFRPRISQLPGFIAYDAYHIAHDWVITISTFDTRAHAEESILLALRWGQEHALELI